MLAGVHSAESLIAELRDRHGATVLAGPVGTMIMVSAPSSTPDDLVPLAECAAIAKCSVDTIKNARRTGALEMFGGQRDRSARRSNLMTWIESRRVRPVAGADDDDMARRMVRLAKSKSGKR